MIRRRQNPARKESVQSSAFRTQDAVVHVSAIMYILPGYRGTYIWGYVLSGHCNQQQISVKTEGVLIFGGYLFTGFYGIQDEADEKTPLPDSKIRPIGPAWSSDSTVKPQWQGSCRCFHALSAKAGATFTWFCLRVMSREEISMPAKICLSKINWFVSEHRQLSLLTIASRYYHEFKQKLFDAVNYSVR